MVCTSANNENLIKSIFVVRGSKFSCTPDKFKVLMEALSEDVPLLAGYTGMRQIGDRVYICGSGDK